MKREPVKSSNIHSAGHDASGMEVQFHGEHSPVWHYADVPADLYEEFKASPSPGTFFHNRIKNHYTGRRV